MYGYESLYFYLYEYMCSCIYVCLCIHVRGHVCMNDSIAESGIIFQ